MLRYVLPVAGALALMSNVALADMCNAATTTKYITRYTPHGVVHKKVVVRRHTDRYAPLVSQKRVIREGWSGSTVSRTRTTHPWAGDTVTRTRTVTRY